VARPDLWWRDVCVAGEIDSREWHFSAGLWAKTLARHNRMTAHGITVMHFTPKQIRTEPRRVIAELRAAIETGRRPLREIRTVPRK
jgi:very-short-patch-repair endonuclease